MSDKERELVEYFIKIVEETPSLHEKWINPPIKITTWKHLLEQDKEIERLNNIINELEKYLIEEIEDYEKQIKYHKKNKDLRSGILDLVGEYEGEKVCFEDTLGKLQELKGDGNNEKI